MKPRRVLLKLSGEAFGGGKVGIDVSSVEEIAKQISKALKEGIQISVVVGGGNFFRGAELSKAGMNRTKADYIGMLGTVMNCLALQEFLKQSSANSIVQSAIPMGQIAEPYNPVLAIRSMEEGKVIIFGAGIGLPYFTTDTVSVQRAIETQCDEVLMAKNGVDGVYSADPKTNPSAKKYDRLSYKEALAKDLRVMDAAALSMARDNSINSVVFSINEDGNIYKALRGNDNGDGNHRIGTIIFP
jgi:uridylate kinase